VSLSTPLTISNEHLTVTLDLNSSAFTLAVFGQTPPFATGTLAAGPGASVAEPCASDIFGTGSALRFNALDGTSSAIRLFPHLPFALIDTRILNSSGADATFQHVPVATLRLDLGLAPTQLRTLGTGGLAAPDTNPGSYSWLAVADPASRKGLVAGWLTHERASGVVFTRVDRDAVAVELTAEYGRLRLAPGGAEQVETAVIGYFADARLGLEAWADAVARQLDIHLPPRPNGFCTWYTDKHGMSSDEDNLKTLTEFCADNLAPHGFNFVQIDDGWQLGDGKGNGPKKNFTDYDQAGPYRSGMGNFANTIKEHGLTPGIWFMPFAGTYNDPWFDDKQDLFVKRDDGTPYDTEWGGTSLDMTNPAAQQYLRAYVQRIAHEWGYTYFKMDGLYTGIAVHQEYVNEGYKRDGFGDAVFFDATKTNIQAFRDGLRLVRDAAGPDVFFLGCTSSQNMRSYGGAFGLVQAMRTGADNGGSYQHWYEQSPKSGSRNYHLNGRIWWNDADPFFVRPTLTLDEARTSASWSAIAGGLNTNSDWIPDLPTERIEIMKRTFVSGFYEARPVDNFENDPPRIWTVRGSVEGEQRDVVALYNWTAEPLEFDIPLADLGLDGTATYAAFDYWDATPLSPFASRLKATLAPHACKILAVQRVLDRPFVLSTSQDVLQGLEELERVQWTGTALTGHSRVVAGDPYILRVHVPHPGLHVTSVDATDDDAHVLEASVQRCGCTAEVTIQPSTSGTAAWSVRFD